MHSASFTITANISNITNDMVSKYTFGVNWYKDGYDTGVYTICRAGGEGQTRYNYEVGAYNAANDWYFIQEKSSTWQELMYVFLESFTYLLHHHKIPFSGIPVIQINK